MISSGLLARIVELAGTYLLHSTTYLLAVGGLLSILSSVARRTSSSPEPADAVTTRLSPLLVERSWKFAALLGLLTAPISLFAGWSQPVWTWSAGEVSPAIVTESPRDRSVHSAIGLDEPKSPDLTREERPQGDRPTLAMQDRLNISQSMEAPESAFRTISSSPADRPPKGLPEEHAHRREVTPNLTSTATIESETNELDLISTRSPRSTRTIFRQRWVELVGWVCLAWLTWSLLRLVSRRCLLLRLISRCEPLQSGIRTQLNRMTPPGKAIQLLRFRPFDTHQRDLKAGPFACGLFRWTIVIPSWVEEELSTPEIQALLAHEMAHLVRRDPWWQLMGEIVCGCLAFQPLNWLARNRWQQATELLCDDWAVQHHATATSPASCLTRIAELRLPGSALLPGLAAIQNSGLLTQRIRWLLRTGRTDQTRSRCGGILAAVLTLLSGIGVSTYGPHISLVQSAEINSSGPKRHMLEEIKSNLTETLNSLESIKAQLPPDVEARLLIESLLARTASLNHRIEQQDEQVVSD